MTSADTIDYGDLGLCRETENEVKEVLGQWEQARRRLELAKMTQAQKQMGVRRTIRDREGNGGEVTMMIPPYLYHKMGSFYGYKCWDDADFCHQFLKHYPECRVKSVSERPTIIVPGMAGFSTS
jgi:hypothetical protein